MKHPSGLRILHLISQRPDSTGSGVYVQAMLRQAARRGHVNHLVAGVQTGREPASEVTGCECSFVCFDGLDTPRPIAGMSDVMPYDSRRFRDFTPEDVAEYEACFAGKLNRAVAQSDPDLIHSHHLWLLTSLARRLFPALPLVASSHGTDLRQFRNCPHLRERVMEGCARLDAVMALSRVQKQEIVKLYGLPEEKVHVIGAGYNADLFCPQTKPVPDPVQIVYAGKLCNAKGTPWFLKALASIHDVSWQLHLVGGGSGSETDQCLNLARGLKHRVRVYGAVEQPRLAAIMKQSHLFVLPSFFEGVPLVMLEALACGCRVVANDIPGVAELMEGMKTGYVHLVRTPRLHAVDNPLAEDLDRFVDDLRAALVAQMTAAVEQPDIDLTLIENQLAAFTWERVFERVETVYKIALDEAR
ncbi:MAG: glycosyltransferase family 4 protein [Thermodesulfobacteriota bacterium]